MKAKDQAGSSSSQEPAKILDVMKMYSNYGRMEFGDTTCTAAVKIPKDRKSRLTPVTIKKSLTLILTKKGDDL